MCNCIILYLSAEEHLGCLQLLDNLNKATINIPDHMSLLYVRASLGYMASKMLQNIIRDWAFLLVPLIVFLLFRNNVLIAMGWAIFLFENTSPQMNCVLGMDYTSALSII